MENLISGKSGLFNERWNDKVSHLGTRDVASTDFDSPRFTVAVVITCSHAVYTVGVG